MHLSLYALLLNKLTCQPFITISISNLSGHEIEGFKELLNL